MQQRRRLRHPRRHAATAMRAAGAGVLQVRAGPLEVAGSVQTRRRVVMQLVVAAYGPLQQVGTRRRRGAAAAHSNFRPWRGRTGAQGPDCFFLKLTGT